MRILRLVFVLVAAAWPHLDLNAQDSAAATANSLHLTAEKHYLNFPIKNDAPLREVDISVDGTPTQKFFIHLADAEPDWWGTFNIAPWQGRALVLSVRDLPADSKALAQIDQTDAPKYPANLYHEALRPKFHYTVAQGWNNDVNVLDFYQGQYHLMYQANPFGITSGNVTWGHAVSKDLVHWKELDPAIYPTMDGDIWSGSAVIDWKNTSGFGQDGAPPMVAVYTRAGNPFGQCISYSVDGGQTFTAYEKNPVVPNVIHANRDPKVFWYEPLQIWVMAFYLGIDSDAWADGKKRSTSIIQFMNSPDLKNWKPRGVAESDPECPDLFPLALDGDQGNQKWILMAADGSYQVGSFDGGNFIPETGKISSRFNANLYYAAQTANELKPGDHRRLQMVWMKVPLTGMNFTQEISVPLELTLRTTADGPRLYSYPAREVESLRSDDPLTTHERALKEGDDPLAQVKNGPLDVEMEIDPAHATGFEFTIQGVPITYHADNRVLSCMGTSTRLDHVNGHVSLRVLSDVDTLEIFADKGARIIPEVLAPDRAHPNQMGLRSLGGTAQIVLLHVYQMKPIWD